MSDETGASNGGTRNYKPDENGVLQQEDWSFNPKPHLEMRNFETGLPESEMYQKSPKELRQLGIRLSGEQPREKNSRGPR